jgi:hypothetical protein
MRNSGAPAFTVDAGAHLHLARALGAADRVEAERHGARRGLDHAHRERGRRALRVGLFCIAIAAGREDECSRDQE